MYSYKLICQNIPKDIAILISKLIISDPIKDLICIIKSLKAKAVKM